MYKYLIGGNKEEEVRLFSVVSSEKWQQAYIKKYVMTCEDQETFLYWEVD